MPIKLWLFAVLIMLSGQAWIDTMRLARQDPPAKLATLVKTSFEQRALGKEVSTSPNAPQQTDMEAVDRQAAQEHLRVEPLTSFAIPFASKAATFDDPAALLMAERVTRRDPQLQLRLAAQGAQRGDVTRSMVHLDKALQIAPALSFRILPGLAAAIPNAQFRDVIRQYAHRPWFWQLATVAAASSETRSDAAQLFVELKGQVKTAPNGALPMIIRSLLAEDRARDAYLTVLASGIISKRNLNAFSPNLANSNPEIAPLSWNLANTDAVMVSLDQRDGWSAIIEPGRFGTLLERVMLTSPGRYQATATYTGNGDPILHVSCLGKPSVELGRAFGNNNLLEIQFSVPMGCNSLFWSISGSAADSIYPIEIYFKTPMELKKI